MRVRRDSKSTIGVVKAVTATMSLLAALVAPGVASAVLERVGPTLPVDQGGYPAWYQDTTGVVLEFCSPINQFELDNGLCLLLPADTTAPESFATGHFSGEHFYWSAGVAGNWALDGFAGGGVDLVLALEAAFLFEPPVNGDQAVFTRLRLRVRDLPVTGDYTFYTPYGRFIVPGVAGDRIFHTDDIGCFSVAGVAGDFTCALQGSIGPYLIPSLTPGGAELPPVTYPEIPGKKYIAPAGYDGPVTNGACFPADACDANGDYITSDGPRNPNIYRIEAPDGRVMFETFNFTVTGRLFSGDIPGRVTPDRSSYSQTATSRQIDTFVTAFPTRQARMPATPVIAPEVPQLQLYSEPCAGAVAPFGRPAGTPVQMARNGTVYFAQTQPAVIPAGVCLEHVNARNTNGQIVPVFFNVRLGDKVNIAEATYDPDTKTLKVVASSSDLVTLPLLSVAAFGDVPLTDIPVAGTVLIPDVAAPPHQVRVLSAQTGSNTMQVVVNAGTGAGNSVPDARDDSQTALANIAIAIDVLQNDLDPDGDPLRIVAATQPANGTVSFAGGLDVTYTANIGYSGPDAFTYTVSDGRGGFDTANVFLSVNLGPNLPPVPADDAATTNFGVPVTLQVLANDTDPNGDAMSVVAVSQPANGGGVVTFTASSVTFTPVPGFSGVAAFTYDVRDTRSGQATGNVQVTVRAQETIAFTRAEYRTGNAQYRIDGTGTVIGSTIRLNLIRNGVDRGVIASPSVDAAGAWTYRGPAPAGLVPVAGDRIRATSSLNTVREQNITVRQ